MGDFTLAYAPTLLKKLKPRQKRVNKFPENKSIAANEDAASRLRNNSQETT